MPVLMEPEISQIFTDITKWARYANTCGSGRAEPEPLSSPAPAILRRQYTLHMRLIKVELS